MDRVTHPIHRNQQYSIVGCADSTGAATKRYAYTTAQSVEIRQMVSPVPDRLPMARK
ncbi:MAG: hypothetical protein JNK90_10735 [Planctomycetaceae bacterium]|nr:hypothetical protein [Planctomycetaceae bacterium]